jgi:predicted transcriptional regulator with HTH domain
MVLSQMSSNQRDKVQYKQLLHTLKEASSVPGSDKDVADYLGLRNRRRIWRNCERIVHELETRFGAVRQKFGKAEIEMKGLTTRHVISISPTSNIQSEIISDVFFVPGPNRRGCLKEITAHFNSERRIIGIEFKLLNEASGRLFGNRSSSRETVVLDSSAVITAILVSFGPLESGQGHSTSIRGLGIIIQESKSEPIYRLGTWTSQDVVQILRAGTEMQIVGVTGEYNVRYSKETFICASQSKANRVI